MSSQLWTVFDKHLLAVPLGHECAWQCLSFASFDLSCSAPGLFCLAQNVDVINHLTVFVASL